MDSIKSDAPIQKDKSVCHICNKWFRNLRSHISDIHDEHFLSVNCNFCDTALKNKKALRKHEMKYHIDRMKSVQKQVARYKCEMCDKNFSNKELYNIHVRTLHKSEQMYSCDLCDKSFNPKSNLESHMRYAHSKDPEVIQCTECNKSLRRENYKNHLKLHESKAFECIICSKQFSRKDNMLDHKRRMHDMERNQKCDQCDYSAFKKSELKVHQVKVHTVQERLFQCGHCGQDFTSANNLKRHKFNVHEKWKHLKCEFCNASFRTPGRLSQHLNAKHVPSKSKIKEFKCHVCNKKYDSKENLRVHKFYIHEQYGRYKCDICEKVCSDLRALKKHIEAQHGAGKPKTVKCDVCEKEFSDVGDFKKHMNYVHNRIKNYSCGLCEKKCFTSYSLKMHLKLIHKLGTSNISTCNICEKKFSMNAGLIKHMNIVHLKIKKYKCERCTKTFSRPIYLRQHFKKVHS